MAGAIRQPIDIPALNAYITSHVPEIKAPVEVKQFGYGQSNPTYQLTDVRGQKFVMRKKPPGQLLSKTAHAVEREYRIIHALEQTDVPVPKAYCLCEDSGVIGTPFYIMEFLDGRIFEDPAFPGVSREERTLMWKSAVETLAKFHRVSPASVGLQSYGRANGFYNRQLKTFGAIQTSQSKARDKETDEEVGKIPHFDNMVKFFGDPRTQPEDRSTFVHGDYKIDNVVFHKTKPYVIGILDWEMSTIGHPLADFVNLITPYTTASISFPEISSRSNPAFREPNLPSGPHAGLPSPQEITAWYSAIAGWDPTPVTGWGEAFSLFKNCIILHGIAARYAMRVASSAKAKDVGAMTKPYAEVGWRMIETLIAEDRDKARI